MAVVAWRKLGIVLALGCGGWWVSAVQAEILPEGWAYRRALIVNAPAETEVKTGNAPTTMAGGGGGGGGWGDQIAWAEFYTNGQQKPDGSDLRVTTSDRIIVPMRVLQINRDSDLVRIAFAVGKGSGAGGGTEANPCYVWWGTDSGGKGALGEKGPGPALDIKRGILAEVYRFPGGRIDSDTSLQRLLKNVGPSLGARFLPEVFIGFNPISDDAQVLIRYSGRFKLEKTTVLNLALSVRGAASLRIDDSPVLYQRGVQREARHKKDVSLTAGWHQLEIVHASDSWETPAISLGVRKEGLGSFVPMGSAYFAPVVVATAGNLETIGQPYTADFSIDGAGEAFIPPAGYMPRYVFECKVPATFKKPALRWDFGDGQTSTLAKVHHYFLTPGIYTVTLTVKPSEGTGGGVSFTSKRRVLVGERLVERFPAPPEDKLRTVSQVLDDYELKKLSGAQLLRGMLLFKFHKSQEDWIKWGQAWLENKESISSDVQLRDETFDLVRLLESQRQYRPAAEAWHLASAKRIGWDMRATLLRWYAVSLCDDLDEAGRAYQVVEEAKNNPAAKSANAQRALGAALVYAAIGKGDGKLASQLAREIGPVQVDVARRQIDQGVLARNVEAAIYAKEYDQALLLLQEWDLNNPSAMVEGFTRLLRVKLLLAQGAGEGVGVEGRKLQAARVAGVFARSLPGSFYAAELLYRSAEAYKSANKEVEAKAALELLQSQYPESPYAQKK